MSNKGKSLCISSAKGGVGKTVITLNLAGCAEMIQKKILIIDLDLTSGGISVALNTESSNNIFTLVNDLNSGTYKSFSDYVVTYDKYIDVLPCPRDPRQASKINTKYMEMIMDYATNYYDFVLVDTSHRLDEISISMLECVSDVLYVITNDPMDLKNFRSIVSILKNANFTNYKVLLNNSRDPFKNYFSLYDMKSIIGTNIDYTLSEESYLKDMDVYMMNGKIPSLNSKYHKVFIKDYTTLVSVVADCLKEDNNE